MFRGDGDDIVKVDLDGKPAVVTFTCKSCQGNTVLQTNGDDLLLVNAIGSYAGTHLVDAMGDTPTDQADRDRRCGLDDLGS